MADPKMEVSGLKVEEHGYDQLMNAVAHSEEMYYKSFVYMRGWERKADGINHEKYNLLREIISDLGKDVLNLRERAGRADFLGQLYDPYVVAGERYDREHRSIGDLAKVASCSVARLEELDEYFADRAVDLAHEMSMYLIPVESKHKALVVRDVAARYVDIAESVRVHDGGRRELSFLTGAGCTFHEAAKLVADVNLRDKWDVVEVMKQLGGEDVGAKFRILEEYRDKGGAYRELKKGSETDFEEIERVVKELRDGGRRQSPTGLVP